MGEGVARENKGAVYRDDACDIPYRRRILETHSFLFKGVHTQAVVSHFACISEDLDGCTENLYLELDHGDALDAAGHADDGGAGAEQFLDRRRAARASTT